MKFLILPLRWRQNGRDSVSNHQPHDCLLNRLFRRRLKKTSKLRVTGLCVGNSPGTGEFPTQMASDAEIVSIWWRHHVRWVSMWSYVKLCRGDFFIFSFHRWITKVSLSRMLWFLLLRCLLMWKYYLIEWRIRIYKYRRYIKWGNYNALFLFFNALRTKQNCLHFADDIFLNGNVWISLKRWSVFLRFELTLFQHWFR